MPVKTFFQFFATVVLTSWQLHAAAQHYIFIESEGQQVFYLKMAQKVYSSNASGFLVLSKLDGAALSLNIGFPENIYPEIAFSINPGNQDRGYRLKLEDGVGWTLTEKGNGQQVGGTVLGLSSGQPDPTLAQKKTVDVEVQVEQGKTAIVNSILGERNGQLEMVFLEKRPGGKTDTIYVQIDRPVEQTKPMPVVGKTVVPRNCTGMVANDKDVRNLQKKLLGSALEDEQIAMVVKAFNDQCYTCKQTLAIGWFFVNEKARLKLFQQLWPLVADPAAFPDLEEAFLSDEGIGSFREMLGLKY
ncbi:MAG: hypothetical protein RLY85_950 [Bacteroidota bacterium]